MYIIIPLSINYRKQLMKQWFLLSVFIFSIPCIGQITKEEYFGTVHYGKILNLETKKKSDLTELNAFIIQATKNALFTLDFSKEASIFKLEKRIEIDGKSTRGAETLYGGGKGIYYSSPSNNYTSHQRDFGGQLYLVEGEFTSIKWQLFKESKKIQDYTCYKAIGTKKILSSTSGKVVLQEIEAWYAPEFPIPYGPIGYNNLPGLIFELTDQNVIYYLKTIEFKDKKQVNLSKPENGIKISEAAFEILAKKLMEQKNEMLIKSKQ